MKKLSKRIISLLLAVVMINTVILGTGYCAFSQDEPENLSAESEESEASDKITITFIRADGSSEQIVAEAGGYIGSLPENTACRHIENTDTHCLYSWGEINENSVFFSDEEVSETEETEDCSFDESGACVICANKSEAEEGSETDEEPEIVESEKISFNSSALRGENEVDFSNLRKTYSKINGYLIDLHSKSAMYSQTSMQNLLDVMSNTAIGEYLNAESLDGFTEEDEAAANGIAEDINSAYASLEKASAGCDLTAYYAAANAINNLDTDAYSETKSLGSAVRIANILVKTTKLTYTDQLNSESASTISCFKGTATQQNIDDATRTILDALYVSVRVYTITTDSGVSDVSFQNGTTTGDESPYTATYASNVIAHSEDENTAWYMDFTSDTTSRGRQLQGFGETFITKVVGNLNIYAEKRTSDNPNLVRVYRKYSNHPEANPIQAVDFVDGSYTLPNATAITLYNFDGFAVNGDTENLKMPGEVITITGDTIINAMYTFNGTASCAINAKALENGTGFNSSVAYNTKIEIKGGDNAYGWVETVDSSKGEYRPFAIGSDILFFATESIELTAVTEEEFNAYNFSLPAINMRKGGAIVSDTKVFFNGQVVDKNLVIKEYGVIIGVSTNGEEVDPARVTLDNVGSFDGYNVFRAKSTKPVGANQFSISVNGLAGKSFIYKGYVIYQKSAGEYVTIYTDTF